MDIQKLKSKLKLNGIELTEEGELLRFQPLRTSELKYMLVSVLFLPCILVVLFITGLSLLGLGIAGVGISFLYNGQKSIRAVSKFNSSFLELTRSEAKTKDTTIAITNIKKFRAGLSTNPLFPNISIIMETADNEIEAFKIRGKKQKYLNEDKYLIVKGLNSLIERNNRT